MRKKKLQATRKKQLLILLLQLLIYFLYFGMIELGTSLNYKVMSVNAGRMPVYVYNYPSVTNSSTHFIFYDFKEVNLPLLADIFQVSTTRWLFRMSIGDLIILESMFYAMLTIILLSKKINVNGGKK